VFKSKKAAAGAAEKDFPQEVAFSPALSGLVELSINIMYVFLFSS
jgi:hypothetical protein